MKKKLFAMAGAALVATLVAGCVPGGQGIKITSMRGEAPSWVPRYEGTVDYLPPTRLRVGAPVNMVCRMKSFTVNPSGALSDFSKVKAEYTSASKGQNVEVNYVMEIDASSWKISANVSRDGEVYQSHVSTLSSANNDAKLDEMMENVMSIGVEALLMYTGTELSSGKNMTDLISKMTANAVGSLPTELRKFFSDIQMSGFVTVLGQTVKKSREYVVVNNYFTMRLSAPEERNKFLSASMGGYSFIDKKTGLETLKEAATKMSEGTSDGSENVSRQSQRCDFH
jgi:hypothetical protein